MSAVFLYLVPSRRLGSDETFAAQAGQRALRPERRPRALGAGGRVRDLGSLFAFMTFAPAALLRDGHATAPLPRFAGRIDPRTGHAGAGDRACRRRSPPLLVLLGSFETIVAYFVFVTVAFLALTVAGLYRLPRPEPGAYRVPGWPVTPLVFLAMLLRDARAARARATRARRSWASRWWPPASPSTVCSSRRAAAARTRAPGGSLMAWIKTIPVRRSRRDAAPGARGAARALPEGVRRASRATTQREHRGLAHADPGGAPPRLRGLRRADVAGAAAHAARSTR